jgi:DNA-binding SARP family transcriptional activator
MSAPAAGRELLPGWYDWVLFEQSRLRQDRVHAFQIIARESLARCDYESALEASEAALELEPLNESAVGLLIQPEREQGNNAAALRAFKKYQVKVREELGLSLQRPYSASSLTFRNSQAATKRRCLDPAMGDRLGK